jgi:hypothetical protein
VGTEEYDDADQTCASSHDPFLAGGSRTLPRGKAHGGLQVMSAGGLFRVHVAGSCRAEQTL